MILLHYDVIAVLTVTFLLKKRLGLNSSTLSGLHCFICLFNVGHVTAVSAQVKTTFEFTLINN